MDVVENVRFGYFHPPVVNVFSGGVRLLVRLGGCDLLFICSKGLRSAIAIHDG